MKSHKVLAIIPARYQSTRLPFKLLHPFQNKTLLQRTYETIKGFHLFDEIVIATDSEIILEHARSFQANCVMTPECPNGSARAAKALELYPYLQNYDQVFNMQGDHPLLSKETVYKLIELLSKSPDAQVVTGVVPIGEEEALSPSSVKCVFDKQGKALYFSRSLIPFQRSESKIYYHHIGIYGFSTPFLLQYPKLASTPCQESEDLEQLKILEHGFSIRVAICNEIPMGIDTPEDIKKFEAFLCKK